MEFIFRHSDGSHVSIDTVHPSLLRSSSFSSPRWYHLQSLSSDVFLVSPLYVAKPPQSCFPAPLCDVLYIQSLSLMSSFLTWSLSAHVVSMTVCFIQFPPCSYSRISISSSKYTLLRQWHIQILNSLIVLWWHFYIPFWQARVFLVYIWTCLVGSWQLRCLLWNKGCTDHCFRTAIRLCI